MLVATREREMNYMLGRYQAIGTQSALVPHVAADTRLLHLPIVPPTGRMGRTYAAVRWRRGEGAHAAAALRRPLG